MVGTVQTALAPARAHVTGPAADAVPALVQALHQGLAGNIATAVLYFASSRYDPADLAGPICDAFPDAAAIGCSTAGEFTDKVTGIDGLTAVALPYGLLTGAVAALGDLSGGAAAGTEAVIADLEADLQVPLRDLDPACHLGFVLIDGMHGAEEEVNDVLGNNAPLLDVVGGSAGDDLAFERTWVAAGATVSYQGVALLVCQTAVPFHVVKTSSFVPTGRVLRITRADVATRTVLGFDDRPAVEAYAEAVGVPVADLDATVWTQHPVGLMIDGKPWIRSPRALTDNGGITFYAQIMPGMEVEVMAATDLVAGTREAIDAAREALGGSASGAVLFNCILRRLEIEAQDAAAPFLASFGGLPLAGFHTYGETWMAHMNQTLTGVVFG
jgi:hypothetical protein